MSIFQNNAISLGAKAIALTAIALAVPVGSVRAETAMEMEATGMAKLDEIADNPNHYFGQTVTIAGEVDDILTPSIFELEENDEPIELLNDDSILILGADIRGMNIREDQIVEVTGEVREFVTSEVDRDYALTEDIDLLEVVEIEYEGRPVIYVDSVRVVSYE